MIRKINSRFSFVGSFFITDSRELVFQILNTGKRLYGDIRIFVHSSKYTGPTKSGITLTKETLNDLVAGLSSSMEQIKYLKKQCTLHKIQTEKPDRSILVSLVESTIDNNQFCIDIREYVKSVNFQGFTKNGIRISIDDVENFIENCLMLIEKM